MTGPELMAVRRRLGMSRVEFGRWLGYRGSARNVYNDIRRYETGKRPIPFELDERDVDKALADLTGDSFRR
jgi:hypothetical protein